MVFGNNLSDNVATSIDTDDSSNSVDTGDSSNSVDTGDSSNSVDTGDSSNSNTGLTFSEAADYFPEASETVLEHVFEESDGNSDGLLSDSELELFKKVRDHTRKYAYNVKNDFVTEKPSSNEKTGYCADHGRVAVVDGSNCPYCIYMGISDTRTKTSSWY